MSSAIPVRQSYQLSPAVAIVSCQHDILLLFRALSEDDKTERVRRRVQREVITW